MKLFILTLTLLINVSELRAQSMDNNFQILDFLSITTDAPQKAVKNIELDKPKRIIKCDIFIAGGGLGGVAAALKIAQLNELRKEHHLRPISIVLSEETDWLGGQATAQGVSALDENQFVETTGCAASYQKFRHAIRNHYKSSHVLSETAQQNKYLNPGNCWVSRLSFEPKVGIDEINTLLTPAVVNSSLKILYRHKPFYIQAKRHLFKANKTLTKPKLVHLINLDTEEQIAVKAKLYLDATELGDLIALAQLPYTSGTEAKEQTNEPHAPLISNTDNVQDFTYPFAVEWRANENHTINKPALYDELVKQGKFSFEGFRMFAEATRQTPQGENVQLLPFWTYRRLIAAENFQDYPHDLSMINWSSNDVRGKNIIDKPASVQAEYLAYGKLVSLGFLYWLQTEAPRDDGGTGYPELFLRPDVMDTKDGLAKYPYIREARRIKAKYTILEQDIAASNNPHSRAKIFTDSVGIGLYPIDIHGHEEIPGAGQAAKPFQIPLASLIPEQPSTILPACKNIGMTHITNGAYRLHPIEWAIGAAQGALSHYALSKKITPAKVLENRRYLREFQKILVETGVPIYWYKDLLPEHPAFAAGQFLAVIGLMPGDKNHLRFYPDKPITREDAIFAVSTLLNNINPAEAALLTQNLASPDKNTIAQISQHPLFKHIKAAETLGSIDALDANPLTRAQFAIWLYKIVQDKRFIDKI